MTQEKLETQAERYECPFCHERFTAFIPVPTEATLLHHCPIARKQIPLGKVVGELEAPTEAA